MVRRIQALSGVVVAAFVAVHLLNTWLAPAGPGAYLALQQGLSLVYQAPLLEWLVLGAIVVHIGCAVRRWFAERGAGGDRSRTWRARLHSYFGVFLMIVIGGHVAAVRLLPGYFGIRPGFDGIAFSLELLPAVFYPYYWLLGVAGAYHALNGLALAAARLGWGWRLSAPRLFAGAATAGALTLLALLAFGGVLFEVGDPWQSDFAGLYRRFVDG
jgi:succinate dehydrogenase/fumarate reductase cytochrome b subunit